MPVMTAVSDSAKGAGARGSATEPCAGRAGIVQQAAVIVQPGAMPCSGPGHPGQGVPALTPGCIAACISAAIPAFETTWPARPKVKARSRMATRQRLTNEPSMPRQHRAPLSSCQGEAPAKRSHRTRLRRLAAIDHSRLFPCLAGLFALAIHSAPALAAATAWVGDTRAAARLITAAPETGSAGRVEAGLQIRLAPGWHTYWRSPGDAGIPPTIDWKGSKNLAEAVTAWPAPRRLSLDGIETNVYEDGVVLPIALRLARPGSPLSLHAEVGYAACKDICVPYHASFALDLPAGPASPAPETILIAAARARVPGDLQAAHLELTGIVVAGDGSPVLAIRLVSTGAPLHAPDLFVEGTKNVSFGRPTVVLAEGGQIATLQTPVRGGSAAEIAGTRLRLTVVDGTRAAETWATPLIGTLPPSGATRPVKSSASPCPPGSC